MMATGLIFKNYFNTPKMEILENIMRLMDTYPVFSIAFCLLIALGLIIYEIVKILMNRPDSPDKAVADLSRHTHKLVREQ